MDPDYILIKPYFVLLYGAFGTACLCLASGPGHRVLAETYRIARGPTLAAVLAVFAALLLLARYAITGSVLLIGAVAVAAMIFAADPLNRTVGRMVIGVATIAIVVSLAWWRMVANAADPLPLAAFAGLLAVWSFALADPGRARLRSGLVPLGVFAVAGLLLLFDLGNYGAGSVSLFTLVHHWGAFTGPALQVRAGLVPFHDMPLQYGLGPTLALAAVCGAADCWRGAQIVFAGATLVGGLLLLAMASAPTIPRGRVWSYGVAGVMFAAVFLWPGFPADGNALAATPSIGGIRFLPVTLVAFLLFFGARRAASAAMVPALLWSPESAAMSIAVFGLCSTADIGLVKAAALAAALLAGSYAGLFLVHRLVYGVPLDPAALFEYVLHVPGALPIDPISDMLLLAIMLCVGGWLMLHPSETPAGRRRDLVATALLFATGSYCLGRSHPNNVCDLAPFLALLAVRFLDRRAPEHETFRRAVALGLAVSVAALALSPWNTVPFNLRPIVDIQAVAGNAGSLEPDIERIRSSIPDTAGLGIADFGPLHARHPSETLVWTPMDPSSLWAFVPSDRRRLYIQRSAARLRRAGWAIFGEDQLFLNDDLRSAYTATNERIFDGAPATPGGPPTVYRLVCFDPQPRLAPIVTGLRCPTGP